MAQSPDLSLSAERRIARRYIGRVQWEMVLVGLGQFLVWLSVFVAGTQGLIPLWAGFPIAVLCCCFAYLPSEMVWGSSETPDPQP